ncbi:MAG: hypothetical protein Q9188_001727 [Gyalolechia gomerana]
MATVPPDAWIGSDSVGLVNGGVSREEIKVPYARSLRGEVSGVTKRYDVRLGDTNAGKYILLTHTKFYAWLPYFAAKVLESYCITAIVQPMRETNAMQQSNPTYAVMIFGW